MGLIFYIGIYFALPNNLDESLTIAVFGSDSSLAVFEGLTAEGLVWVTFPSDEALHTAVANGDYEVGVILPPSLGPAEPLTFTLLFNANLPAEFREMYTIMFRELSLVLTGQPLNVEVNEEILGTDRGGNQIPYRDRLLPLFAVFVLLMEMLGLASLITSEISSGTITALLVTPLRVEGLFTAKGVFGVGLAFTQAAILLGVTGGLAQQPLLMLLAIFLGALLVTGVGFLMATVASDLLSVLGWGMLAILIMALPALGVLIPGFMSDWVRIIPSYYLVNTVYQVLNEPGWGWAQAWPDLLALALFALLFLALGVFTLRRRFQ